MHQILYGALLLAFIHNAASSSLFHVNKLPIHRADDIDLGEVDYNCPGTGALPAQDCDKYYTCYEGTPVHLWQCRLDYLFDLRYDGCNFPEQVDCGNRTRPGGTNPPGGSTTARPTTLSPFTCTTNGFFPIAPNACSANYIACVDGVAYPQTCPGNGIFDPDRGLCALPETVPCYSSSTTSRPTSGPFVCPQPDGTFPDPNDCSQFYTCTNNIAVPTPCPDGLVFNPNALVCDFVDNVPSCQVKSKHHKLFKVKSAFYARSHN